MTLFERLQKRVAERDEHQRKLRDNPALMRIERDENVRKARAESARLQKARSADKDDAAADGTKVFDADAWRPTPKALEMLAKVDKRSAAELLAKRRSKASVAEENERRYAAVADPYADRAMAKYNRHTGGVSGRYDTIAMAEGLNGDCNSRMTTFRRFKYGKGSMGRDGWLKAGFKENMADTRRRSSEA